MIGDYVDWETGDACPGIVLEWHYLRTSQSAAEELVASLKLSSDREIR